MSLNPRQNKYRNRHTVVDGIRFDSAKEAKRWGELCLMARADAICDLERQPVYVLDVNGVPVCRYRADFRYFDPRTGKVVVEDVKGFLTPEYKIKRALMKAVHRIDVVEV